MGRFTFGSLAVVCWELTPDRRSGVVRLDNLAGFNRKIYVFMGGFAEPLEAPRLTAIPLGWRSCGSIVLLIMKKTTRLLMTIALLAAASGMVFEGFRPTIRRDEINTTTTTTTRS